MKKTFWASYKPFIQIVIDIVNPIFFVTVIVLYLITFFKNYEFQYITIFIIKFYAISLIFVMLLLSPVWYLSRIKIVQGYIKSAGDFGLYHKAKWNEIKSVKLYNVFGLEYLRVKSKNKEWLNIPLFLNNLDEFIDLIGSLAGKGNLLYLSLLTYKNENPSSDYRIRYFRSLYFIIAVLKRIKLFTI